MFCVWNNIAVVVIYLQTATGVYLAALPPPPIPHILGKVSCSLIFCFYCSWFSFFAAKVYLSNFLLRLLPLLLWSCWSVVCLRGKAYRSPVTFWRPWARFTNYLTTVLRSSYNNVTVIIIIKDIYIAQVRKGHKCAMSAELAVWLRNCLSLYSYLHN